ncbi:hypothetical protein [Labilibaculum sp.]|uniref:hypothetical protein n=1 Tax=Labilibaculum sp. TaxID=2060723 RepID=UPI003563FF9D
MKRNISLYTILLLTVIQFLSTSATAQNRIHESERIYLHTHKNTYLAGESVLFKMYCINSVSQKPSSLSKIAYLELINEEGYAVAQDEIILQNGMGEGGFLISKQLATGNYAINAYTYWMNSCSPEFNSVTPIFVFNNQVVSEKLQGNLHSKNTNAFFSLKNSNNPILLSADSVQKEKSISIHSSVEDLDRLIRFSIFNAKNSPIATEPLHFQIASNQGIEIDQKFQFNQNKWEFVLPKKEIKSSNFSVCIKNSEGKIITQSAVHLTTDKRNLFFERAPMHISTNEKVNIQLNKNDFTKENETIYLSASISLKEAFPTSPSIINYFNLYSDFGASMNVYFNQIGKIPNQNWISKGELESLWLHSKPSYPATSEQYPEEEAYVLKGQIKNQENKEVIVNKSVFLSKIGEYADLNTIKSNKNGEFFFLLPLQKGLHDISIQLNNDDMEECTIQLKEKFKGTGFAPVPWKKSDLTTNQIEFLKKRYQDLKIREIYKQKIYTETIDSSLHRATSNFFGKAYSSIKIDNYIRLDSLEEYFHEFISPVKIKYRNKKTYMNVFSPEQTVLMKQAPLILYDGLLISNPRIILDKNPSEIDKIEIVPFEYYFGSAHFYGIIHVISKNKDCKIEKLPKNTERYYLPLFTDNWHLTQQTETNAPFIPDFRTDLLWEPNIRLSENQNSNLQFTTSDVKGEYELRMEGISESGEPIVVRQSIFVE